MKALLRHLALLMLLAAAGAGHAADAWTDLSNAERTLLAPLAQDWETLDPEQRERLRTGAQRWQAMAPRQRAEVVGQFERWQSLAPDERARVRERYRKFSALPPEEQKRIRANQQWYRGLPPDAQRRIRQRWHDATPEQREALRERTDQARDRQERLGAQPLDGSDLQRPGRLPEGRNGMGGPGMHGPRGQR
jgi:hypothetical protein